MIVLSPAKSNKTVPIVETREVFALEKKKRIPKMKPKMYKKPKVEKHENLKDITLLSFTPPEN